MYLTRYVYSQVVDWIDLAQGQMAGVCERGYKPSGSTKSGEFFDRLMKY